MLRSRIIPTIGAVALVLAVPATAAAQDLRTPDARGGIAPPDAGQELRTPDARSAGDAGETGREPQAIDARGEAAAAGHDPQSPAAPAAAPDPFQSVGDGPDGFGWGDAGIGAAGTLGIVLALAGIAVLTGPSRRRRQVPAGRR
jgi:hypothetical protein